MRKKLGNLEVDNLKKYILLIFLFILIISNIYGVGVAQPKNKVYAYVIVKDYFENNPLENITFSITLYSRTSTTTINGITNSSGSTMINITDKFQISYRIPVIVQSLKIYNSTYVPIRVNNLLLEENNIVGEFYPVTNVSEITLKSPCRIMRIRGKYIIEIIVSLANGTKVNITDYNPFTSTKEDLVITPALHVIGSETTYITQYIFPIGYPVLIKRTQGGWENRFTVSKPNTTIL